MNGYVNREYFKTRKYCTLNKLIAEYTHELEDLFLFAKQGELARVFWKCEGWEELNENKPTGTKEQNYNVDVFGYIVPDFKPSPIGFLNTFKNDSESYVFNELNKLDEYKEGFNYDHLFQLPTLEEKPKTDWEHLDM